MAKDKKLENSNKSSSQDENAAESAAAKESQLPAQEQAEQPSTDKNDATSDSSSNESQKNSTDEALAKLKAELDAEKKAQSKESSKESPKEEKPSATKSTKTSDAKSKTKNSGASEPSKSKNSQAVPDTLVPDNLMTVPKAKRSWFAVLAFLISLGASAAVAFLWWQNQVWLKNQAQVEQLKQQSLVNSQQAINQLQSRLTELQNAQTQQVTNNDVIQQSLNSYAARINELGQSQPNFWLAAESKYLINLAERRLLVEQDVDTAIQLLLDANQRLTAMQDPSVFHIRSAISEDVASLYALKTPETDAVYLTLSGLVSEAQQIKFAQAYIPKPAEHSEVAEQVSDNVNDWQQNLMISLKRFFGSFIKITKRDAEVQPQLPADQQWYVRSNLTTQLYMAQTATLDKHSQRYQDSISRLQLWTKQYFDLDDVRVAAFLTSLDALSQKDVSLNLPSGLSSQALVSNYVTEQLGYKKAQAVNNSQSANSVTEAVNND